MSRADIVCLCDWHGVGGAQLDAGMLVEEFRTRGYAAQLGFLFEREVEARHGVDDCFTVSTTKPRRLLDLPEFVLRCRKQIAGRRPTVVFGFNPMANVVGALVQAGQAGRRFIGSQRNPAEQQSSKIGRLERWIGATGLYATNIAVSQTVADTFGHYGCRYLKKLRVVHNGTPSLAGAIEDGDECRRRFGWWPAGRSWAASPDFIRKGMSALLLRSSQGCLMSSSILLASGQRGTNFARMRAASRSANAFTFLGRSREPSDPILPGACFPVALRGFRPNAGGGAVAWHARGGDRNCRDQGCGATPPARCGRLGRRGERPVARRRAWAQAAAGQPRTRGAVLGKRNG